MLLHMMMKDAACQEAKHYTLRYDYSARYAMPRLIIDFIQEVVDALML